MLSQIPLKTVYRHLFLRTVLPRALSPQFTSPFIFFFTDIKETGANAVGMSLSPPATAKKRKSRVKLEIAALESLLKKRGITVRRNKCQTILKTDGQFNRIKFIMRNKLSKLSKMFYHQI